MKHNILNIIIFLVGSFVFFSCNQDDPNVKETETVSMDGEWFVTYKVDDGSGNLIDVGGGYSKILTTNTAANSSTEILVTDYVDPDASGGNFWSYKVKAQADPKALTFSANESVSSALYDGEPYAIKVNVLNGHVLKGAGLSKTKVKVDSIYFELQFEDDDPAFGNTYVVSGHKRTGFAEDEF